MKTCRRKFLVRFFEILKHWLSLLEVIFTRFWDFFPGVSFFPRPFLRYFTNFFREGSFNFFSKLIQKMEEAWGGCENDLTVINSGWTLCVDHLKRPCEKLYNVRNENYLLDGSQT